jgi:hypothetical protein
MGQHSFRGIFAWGIHCWRLIMIWLILKWEIKVHKAKQVFSNKSSSPRGSFHANARACEQNPVIGTTDEPFFVFFSAKGVSRFWRARLLAHDYLSKNKKDEPSN